MSPIVPSVKAARNPSHPDALIHYGGLDVHNSVHNSNWVILESGPHILGICITDMVVRKHKHEGRKYLGACVYRSLCA